MRGGLESILPPRHPVPSPSSRRRWFQTSLRSPFLQPAHPSIPRHRKESSCQVPPFPLQRHPPTKPNPSPLRSQRVSTKPKIPPPKPRTNRKAHRNAIPLGQRHPASPSRRRTGHRTLRARLRLLGPRHFLHLHRIFGFAILAVSSGRGATYSALSPGSSDAAPQGPLLSPTAPWQQCCCWPYPSPSSLPGATPAPSNSRASAASAGTSTYPCLWHPSCCGTPSPTAGPSAPSSGPSDATSSVPVVSPYLAGPLARSPNSAPSASNSPAASDDSPAPTRRQLLRQQLSLYFLDKRRPTTHRPRQLGSLE